MITISLQDKCSKCGVTHSKAFWDFADGSVLCDKCKKRFGAKWKKEVDEKFKIKIPKKTIKVSLVLISIVAFLFVAGYIIAHTCPSSCDDGNKCTADSCSSYTGYKCYHKDIVPCIGNGKCEQGEYGTTECPNCNDNNLCTKDSINYAAKQCFHETIANCVGNGKCEQGEYGTKDCPNCDDYNECTRDSINYQTGECVHTLIGGSLSLEDEQEFYDAVYIRYVQLEAYAINDLDCSDFYELDKYKSQYIYDEISKIECVCALKGACSKLSDAGLYLMMYTDKGIAYCEDPLNSIKFYELRDAKSDFASAVVDFAMEYNSVATKDKLTIY